MAAGACKNGPGAPESNEMPDDTMSSAGSGGEGTGSQVSSGKAGTAGLSGDTSAGGMNVGASGAGGAAGVAGEQSEGGAAGSGGASAGSGGASAGSGGGKAVAKCRRAPGFDPDCTAKYPDKPAAYACDTAEMASRLSDSYTPACSSIDLTLAGRFNECCPPHSP